MLRHSLSQRVKRIVNFGRSLRHFGDALGDAVIQLNAGIEADWALEKVSLTQKFPSLPDEKLMKMKSLFVKDIYHPRAQTILTKETGIAPPPLKKLKPKLKKDDKEDKDQKKDIK